MVLNKDFREFIELLNAHEVSYLVIGGYAVNAHGYPRYTKDIDFWIWLTEDNIEKLLKVIRDFGFGSLGLQKSDFTDPDTIVQLGYEPYRIDLLMDVSGADFETCFRDKSVVTLENTPINFLGLDHLIEIKHKAGRLQDLADAENLDKIRKKRKQ